MSPAHGGRHVGLRDLVTHDAVPPRVGVAVQVFGVRGRLGPRELVEVKRVGAAAGLGLKGGRSGGGGGVEHGEGRKCMCASVPTED